MPTAWWIAVGASVGVLAAAFVAVGGHHELVWRWQRRSHRAGGLVELDRRNR